MPDPKLATPVKAVLQGSKWAVVDADGKQVEGGGPFTSKKAAQKLAARINGAWKKAKAVRKAKGAPEITEGEFQERLHPRGRTGRWVKSFAVKGTLENRAADVHGINALIRDAPEGGRVNVGSSGLHLVREKATGYRAISLRSKRGLHLQSYPAGMPMVAAADAVAAHHRGQDIFKGGSPAMELVGKGALGQQTAGMVRGRHVSKAAPGGKPSPGAGKRSPREYEQAAERAGDAYMAGTYGPSGFRLVARHLQAQGHSPKEAEAILRSKHMRWADDSEGRGAGKAANSAAFKRYYAKNKKQMTGAALQQMMEETFGEDEPRAGKASPAAGGKASPAAEDAAFDKKMAALRKAHPEFDSLDTAERDDLMEKAGIGQDPRIRRSNEQKQAVTAKAPWKAEVAANRSKQAERLKKGGLQITPDEMEFLDEVWDDDDTRDEYMDEVESGTISGDMRDGVIDALQKSKPTSPKFEAIRNSLIRKLGGKPPRDRARAREQASLRGRQNARLGGWAGDRRGKGSPEAGGERARRVLGREEAPPGTAGHRAAVQADKRTGAAVGQRVTMETGRKVEIKSYDRATGRYVGETADGRTVTLRAQRVHDLWRGGKKK